MQRPSIDAKLLLRLSELARIELTPMQRKQFTRDLGEILDYVDKLKKQPGLDVESTLTRLTPRADQAKDDTWFSAETIIANIPIRSEKMIKVPDVLPPANA